MPAPSTTFQVDFTNYREKMSARVPEGEYNVVVDDVQLDETTKGDPMINTWLVITDGESRGEVIVDRLVVNEKALFRLVNFMRAIGLDTPKKRLQIDAKRFLHKKLTVELADGQPYQGTVRSEVRNYIRMATAAPAAEEEAADSAEEPDFNEDGFEEEIPNATQTSDEMPDLEQMEL